MLDPDYSGRDATAAKITDEIGRLAGIVGNQNLSEEVRVTAASSLGSLMGSMQEAGRLYIADARGSTESKVENVRLFTDLVSDKLLERGGPLGSALGGEFVDSLWEGLVDRAENQATSDVKERIGGLTDFAQVFRSAMQNLDANLINAFDDRLDQYYDGPEN
jgi:hypothetical protein